MRFLYITWMAGCVGVTYHIAPGYAMGRGQAGGGSAMLRPMFCWETLGPAIHLDITFTLTTYLLLTMYNFSWKRNSLLAVASFSRITCRATKQNWLRKGLRSATTSLKCWPNFPDLTPIEHLRDVLDKQVRSMEAPPRNLQDFKDVLLTPWCQIPPHTFRGLAESMPQRVRAMLAAKGEPTQY